MVGGGYCRLQVPLKPAVCVRETVAGHRLGALEGRRGAGKYYNGCTGGARATPAQPASGGVVSRIPDGLFARHGMEPTRGRPSVRGKGLTRVPHTNISNPPTVAHVPPNPGLRGGSRSGSGDGRVVHGRRAARPGPVPNIRIWASSRIGPRLGRTRQTLWRRLFVVVVRGGGLSLCGPDCCGSGLWRVALGTPCPSASWWGRSS